MFDNKTQSSSDEGVSPVIGVILMVAITVVLAAVIGTFVLNLTDNLEQSAQAAVSFDETVGSDTDVQLNNVQKADEIYVTSEGGSVASGVELASATCGPNAADADANGSGECGLLSGSGSGGVGTTVNVSGYTSDGTISVIGVLKGKENVIQTYDYTA